MQDDLVAGLKTLLGRGIRFALSYDGMTGGKEYGPPLPEELNLTRLLLHAGRSSQATLVGRSEDTVESLYLSPGLAEEVDRIIRPDDAVPKTLALFD
jgi:DNA adenine methylase